MHDTGLDPVFRFSFAKAVFTNLYFFIFFKKETQPTTKQKGMLFSETDFGSNENVNFLVERTLLRAVEALDTARERVKLSEICNNNVEVFGRPNSTQRKCVQTFWQNVKRQHIRGYVRRLEKFGILPSKTTRRLLEGANSDVIRQHIRVYVRRLEEGFGTFPSEATLRLLEGAKMVPSPDNSNSDEWTLTAKQQRSCWL